MIKMTSPEQQTIEQAKHIGDAIAGGIAAAGVLDWFVDYGFPSAAAILTIIWMVIRIWETETVKRLTGRWKEED